MTEESTYKISLEIETEYLNDLSEPQRQHFVFGYTIIIHNQSSQGVKLLNRQWFITDADGQVQTVEGEGVVGKQPYLNPGESFEYNSGAVLATPVGSMQGSYQFIADDGALFDAEIPPFRLANPQILH